MEPQQALPSTNWATTLQDINTHAFTHHAYGGKLYPLNEDQIAYIHSILEELNSNFSDAIPALQSSQESLSNLGSILSKTIKEKQLMSSTEAEKLDKTITLCQEIYSKVNSILPNGLNLKEIDVHCYLKPIVKKIDAELFEFSERLINEIPNYHAKHKWTQNHPELTDEENPFADSEDFEAKFHILFFDNLEARLKNHPERLSGMLVHNLNQIVEAYCTYNTFTSDREKYFMAVTCGAHKITIPMKELVGLIPDISLKDFAGLCASGQFSPLTLDAESLLNTLKILHDQIRYAIDGYVVPLPPTFFIHCYQHIALSKAGQTDALLITQSLYLLHTLYKSKLFPQDGCSELVEFFNSSAKVYFLDGEKEIPLVDLLALRKLSEVVDRTVEFHATHLKPLYDFKDIWMTRDEFALLSAFARSAEGQVSSHVHILEAYSSACFLLIQPLKAFYEERMLKDFDERSLSSFTIDPHFTPEFKKRLLDTLLNLLDKNGFKSTNFQAMFNLYGLCVELAEESDSMAEFVNRMLKHFPALVRELKMLRASDEVDTADFEERINEIKTYVLLIDRLPDDLSEIFSLYKLFQDLSLEFPFGNKEELLRKLGQRLDFQLTPAETIVLVKSIKGIDKEIDKLCLDQIIERLIRSALYEESLIRFFELGVELAASTQALKDFGNRLFFRFADFLVIFTSNYLHNGCTLQEFTHRVSLIKSVLDAMPTRLQPLRVDLRFQNIVSIEQLKPLAVLPMDALFIKNTNWFSIKHFHRFHRDDRKSIVKLFPHTKIYWI